MSSFRFEAEIDGSELENFVENVVNNVIDYEMIANEVAKEIQISEEMLDDAISKHIDYAAIADEVDIDRVCSTLIYDYISEIQDAIDIDEISESVLERVDITELTNDVMNEMNIQDEIEMSFNHNLEESLSGFDPNEKNPLNISICNAIKSAIIYLSKNGEIAQIPPVSLSADESKIQQVSEKKFTPDDILAIVSSCVISSMYGIKADVTIGTDRLINRAINALPEHIRSFINNK